MTGAEEHSRELTKKAIFIFRPISPLQKHTGTKSSDIHDLTYLLTVQSAL